MSRVLTDTDGDGFTDSFWFHVPGRGSEGTMQVVGVSVTDNSGRLNANTATRFIKSDEDFNNGVFRTRTRGWTPSDLALVGQNAEWTYNNSWAHGNTAWGPSTHDAWNVGFFDTPAHSSGFHDLEVNVGLPSSAYDLVGYFPRGQDVVDRTPAEQAESEVYPVWQSAYYRGDTMGDYLTETSVQYNAWFPDTNDIH